MSSQQTITTLTTLFTQPTSCISSWTYEAEFFNSVSNGILLQNAIPLSLDTECFPPTYTGSGRGGSGQIFSPGICFSGYTTGILHEGLITTAVCCPLNFAFTASLAVNAGQSTPAIFSGCISTYNGGLTSVPARSPKYELSTTAVAGPITMWAQPISVAFQQKDLSLFHSSTTGLSSLSSATVTAIITPGNIAETPRATASLSPARFSPVPPLPASHLSTSLSIGAIIGISLSACIIILAVSFALTFNFQTRKQKKSYLHLIKKDNYDKGGESSNFTSQRAELPTGREVAVLYGDGQKAELPAEREANKPHRQEVELPTEREVFELHGESISVSDLSRGN